MGNTRFFDLSNESNWRTPSRYIEAARRAMGTIDLDPASDSHANETVKAEVYFSPERGEDGLALYWAGNVWLNPPYSDFRGQAAAWIGKLHNEWHRGFVAQAIALVNLGTAYQHVVQAALKDARCICIPAERIAFVQPPGHKGKTHRPTQANMLIYFGARPQLFAREFRQFGVILDVAQMNPKML